MLALFLFNNSVRNDFLWDSFVYLVLVSVVWLDLLNLYQFQVKYAHLPVNLTHISPFIYFYASN